MKLWTLIRKKLELKLASRLNLRLEESLQRLSILFNISRSLTSSIDPDELCNQSASVILKNMDLKDFAILLVNEDQSKLEIQAAKGFKKNAEVQELSFDLGEGISGQVAQLKKSIYLPDTSLESHYLAYKGMKSGHGSFLSIPILAKGKLLGVMNFSREQVDAFSAQEREMLQVVSGQVAIALENAYLYTKTKELSITDELTQIYNRRHFQSMLEMELKRAKRFQRSLSLLMIDVDHFKKFNDRWGHVEGDWLLVQLSKVFKENLREVDTLARYGGEEFAVILPNTGAGQAHQVALKLNKLRVVMSGFPSEQSAQEITVSIGVATYPDHGLGAEDLVNHADIALYGAKGEGRNCVVVCDTPVHE